AGVVVVDMLAAITLLPAILSLWVHRIAPAKPRTREGVFGRLATMVQRRAVLTLVATAGLLVLLVAPAVHMRLSNSDARALPPTTQTRQLYDQLAAHYPDQVGTPPIVVVAPAGTDPTELSARIAGIAGIARVEERAVPGLTVLAATPTGTAASAQAVADIRGISDDLVVGGTAAHLADYRDMLRTYGPWAGLAV